MLNDQPASAEATAQQAPNGLLVLRWKTDVAGFRGLECGERPEPKKWATFDGANSPCSRRTSRHLRKWAVFAAP